VSRSFLTPLSIAACLCAAGDVVPVETVPAPLRSDLEESVRLDAVEAWPFVVVPRKPGGESRCLDVGPQDLVVTDGGEPGRILSVDDAIPVTTQVLMLDTSDSMFNRRFADSRRKNRHMRTAAHQYVGWVQQETAAAAPGAGVEALMVVTFDDTARMIFPPTVIDDLHDARRLQARIARMTGGFNTKIYDSLVRVVRYVDAAPGRTAILLLSDGTDSASERYVPSGVYRALRQANSVTVFPIQVGVGKGPHRRFLNEIARISGGKSYNASARVDGKFREIRDRLEGQRYVSYLTRPPGELPVDARNTDAEGNLFRKVRIRLAEDSPLRRHCTIPEDGYRPERFVRGTQGAGAGPAVETLEEPAPVDRIEPASWSWDRESLQLRVERPRSPEDIVHDWLIHDLFVNRYAALHEMNGEAFLDRMPELAEEAFRNRGVLREWALAKRRARIEAEFRRQVPPPSAPSELEAYETTLDLIVDREMAVVRPSDYQHDLAAWLDDVTSRELAFRVERKAANQWLSGADEAVLESERVQREWSRLQSWLPYSDTEPVVALLELVCDAARNVCGYYRVVRPRTAELVRDYRDQPIFPPETAEDWMVYGNHKVPRHPLGLMTLRWLLGDPRPDWRVASIEHEPIWLPPEGKLKGRGAKKPDCRHRVVLDLASDTRIELEVDGFVDGEGTAGPGRCEVAEEPLRIEPRCWVAVRRLDPKIEKLLRGAGLSECK
jgi:hypothetical protein